MTHEPLLALNWNLLFSAITVFVLFLILKKFFFEKVHNFMEAREDEIKARFEEADTTSRLAEQKLADYEKHIKDCESEGRKIIRDARKVAKYQADTIVDEANEKARQMTAQAEAEIARERAEAINELRGEVGNLAVMAAEQIIRQELGNQEQHEIVDRIIKEAEETSWN